MMNQGLVAVIAVCAAMLLIAALIWVYMTAAENAKAACAAPPEEEKPPPPPFVVELARSEHTWGLLKAPIAAGASAPLSVILEHADGDGLSRFTTGAVVTIGDVSVKDVDVDWIGLDWIGLDWIGCRGRLHASEP